MRLGICAYPLSQGKETGRGLERVVEQIHRYFSENKIAFDFYDAGIIRDEWMAVFGSFFFLKKLAKTKNECYLAVYPVAAIFPLCLRKKPLVTAVHDLVPLFVRGYDHWLKYAVKRWCIRRACRQSDVLIVSFSSTKKKIAELFHVDPDKIEVISYGVDHRDYYPDATVAKVKNRVAFLGEAKRAKGLDSLIIAFKTVLKNVPDATLVLASNGNEIEMMKKLTADLLPPSCYEFVGFVPEEKMREFYNAADVLVFPSRYGFGLSALEAMACGTPAILGSCLDSMDFISDRDLLVNPDDTDEIALKITSLLTDKAKHAEKSSHARNIASKYSPEKMSKRYYEVCLKAAVSLKT